MNQNIVNETIEKYFQSEGVSKLIDKIENERLYAINLKYGFYRKNILSLIAIQLVIFYIIYQFTNSYGFDIFYIAFMIVPGCLYRYYGKYLQDRHIDNSNLTSQLFADFIKFIYPKSDFDEEGTIFNCDSDTLGLFMDDYDDKSMCNSFKIYHLDGSDGCIELTGVECSYSKTVRSGKKSRTVYDNGILFMLKVTNPKRILKSEVLIKAHDDGWFVNRNNQIKLEDPEFESWFDVYGSDEVEARMLLTPNIMKNLVEFKKNNFAEFVFKIKENTLYVKKKIIDSPLKIDWDNPVLSNKNTYIAFYNELQQINQIMESFNLEFYSK